MDRIAIHYTYTRRSPVVVDVHGYVDVGEARRIEDDGCAVFRENHRWVASDSLAIDQGGTVGDGLRDAISYARDKIETRLRMRVIGGGDKTIAVAELDAFMETHEPGASREELSARVKDLTSRVTMVEVNQGEFEDLNDGILKLSKRVKKLEEASE